jgi:anti-sigma B factor antagonist
MTRVRMSTPNLSLNVDADQATIALVGEHEAFSADKLAQTLERVLDEGMNVNVDLRDATFVDSTVIGVLLAASRRARRQGLVLRLLIGDETGWPVRRLFDVTGLRSEIDVLGP